MLSDHRFLNYVTLRRYDTGLVTTDNIIRPSPQVGPLRNIGIAVHTVQNFSLPVIINPAWDLWRPIRSVNGGISFINCHLLVLLSTQKTGINWVVPLLIVMHRRLLIFLQIDVIRVGSLLNTIWFKVLHAHTVTPKFFLIIFKSAGAVDFILTVTFVGRFVNARLAIWIAEHLTIKLLLFLFLIELLCLQTLFLHNILTAINAWDFLLLFVPTGWDGHL